MTITIAKAIKTKMKRGIIMEVKAYNNEAAEKVFSELFCNGLDREDGLKEVPAASLQLLVSALEYITWDFRGKERDIIKQATALCEELRDQQKLREWRRKENSTERV